ncbi:MAG: cupin [Mucilaginibacter sp.]|nr:cupin [Mucilaginibacter sp.]
MSQPKEIIKIGQLELRFLLDGDDTNNQMVVFEFLIPPGSKVPAPHYHEAVDELIYGLEGTATSTVDGKKIEIAKGDKCFIARGQVHHHDNHTNETVKLLCVLSPASIGPAYFRELGELLKVGDPPDPEKVKEIMGRHGLIVSH